ncbi:hypothetical protein NECAME_03044 [Necator americanus]|uniref:Uncharacterized protein n=1 Tax=Necator americanus TaxID=51031 RepID=W2TA50_NECAM|nr:hypothetical protein NECAME_03044 [Necator americanus]ETN77872.1 hypothetical protein NECAME_03044 [Necator americanus]
MLQIVREQTIFSNQHHPTSRPKASSLRCAQAQKKKGHFASPYILHIVPATRGHVASLNVKVRKLCAEDEQVYKGCNDPANPAVACQTLQSNCQAQGGTGQCFTCNYEFCNSSAELTSFVVLAAAILFYSI